MLSTLTTRLHRLRAQADAGVTLVELVVAMTLSTIVAAMTLTLFINVNDSTQRTVDSTIGTAQARDVLEAWTSYLRVADGPTPGHPLHRFEWIQPSDMFFYADLRNRTASIDTVTSPTGVWLRLTGGRLIEEQFAYGATSPSTCRILADRVTSPALFTAYDATYTAMSSAELGQPMATGGAGCTDLPGSGVSQSDIGAVVALQQVSRVGIAFTIADPRNLHTESYGSSADVPVLAGGTS